MKKGTSANKLVFGRRKGGKARKSPKKRSAPQKKKYRGQGR